MIELEVKIPDEPGSLIRLIEPISANSGNIYGIIHNHKEKSGGFIPVWISFEIISGDKKENLERIKRELKNRNIRILKITNIPAFHHVTVILSGHVFRKNFEDTIKRLALKGAQVHQMEAKFTTPDEISNVKFTLEIPDELEDTEVLEELRKICEEKNLFMLVEERL